jgi:hypothetical protein
MATPISLSPDDNNTPQPAAPECDHATGCYWFETAGVSNSRCANRHSLVCRKRRDDVFAPYERKNAGVG